MLVRQLFQRERGVLRRGVDKKIDLCCEAPFNERHGCRECHLCRTCGTTYDFHLPFGDSATFNLICFKCANFAKDRHNKRGRVILNVTSRCTLWERFLHFGHHSVDFVCPHRESSYRMCHKCLQIIDREMKSLDVFPELDEDPPHELIDYHPATFAPFIVDVLIGSLFSFDMNARRMTECECTLWDKMVMRDPKWCPIMLTGVLYFFGCQVAQERYPLHTLLSNATERLNKDVSHWNRMLWRRSNF